MYSNWIVLLLAIIVHISPLEARSSSLGPGYELYLDTPNTWEDPYWPSNGQVGISQPKCVDIPENLTLCQGIGYKQMRLPNLLGHDNLAEVSQQAGAWMALNNIKCHGDTQLFLCSLFSPVCLDKEIYPCKSLCEAVKKGCEKRMSKYGFPWPDMVRCDKFPDDNGLCIKAQTTATSMEGRSDDPTCAPCREPNTVEGIIDNFCRADFVLAVKIRKRQQRGSDLIVRPRKKQKAFKTEGLNKRDLRRAKFVLKNAPCDCQRIQGDKNDKFLLMGQKKNNDLVITFVLRWDNDNNRAIRRAIRVTKKKKDICKGGADVLDVENRGNKKRRKRKDNKKRNGNREEKGPTSRSPHTMMYDEPSDVVDRK